MSTTINLEATITPELAGIRLDQALAKLFPDYSRARWQAWLAEGAVLVDGKQLSVRSKTQTGQVVRACITLATTTHWEAQELPLTIVYEDEAILVINKPAGLVVHPGAGNVDQTLVNALLHHAPELQTLPRGGIVHRLDKETSGLLVVAKTLAAHHSLVKQLQSHQVEREYQAVVNGILLSGGTIEAPIGRHPTQRTRMAIVSSGRPAVSHYRIIERFRAHTQVRVHLETGRTHQIRVHMASIHHPLVGDPLYGGRLRLPAKASPALKACLLQFKRQALHAQRLTLAHPMTGETMSWEAALPTDMNDLLNVLRADKLLDHE
ncbi:MAG: 23S rRNA pseudouridine(1911/1915/1917) synthase RluD [Coxiellaceae bacterium]|nr:MAG: 23S rRNA pseudouridine(1911/1915/1917) synthase RluD [Coxiellaceae bacterium]